MIKIDNQFWIIMGIAMIIVAALTFKKTSFGPKIGSCYIAFQNKSGKSILKVISKKDNKFYVQINEAGSNSQIKGLFSEKEILELSPTSCP